MTQGKRRNEKRKGMRKRERRKGKRIRKGWEGKKENDYVMERLIQVNSLPGWADRPEKRVSILKNGQEKGPIFEKT